MDLLILSTKFDIYIRCRIHFDIDLANFFKRFHHTVGTCYRVPLEILTGGAATVQSMPVMWKKSSYSQVNGHCVEISAQSLSSIRVRDSKNPQGEVLRFAPAEWSTFLGDVRNGRFE